MTRGLLDVPDVRQESDYDCGRACLKAVFAFWGEAFPKHLSALTNQEQGTHPDTLSAILRESRRFELIDGSMSVDLLRMLTRNGWPVLVVLTPPGKGGHWVVVRGVARGRVYYHCPTHGRCSLPVASWEDAWDDRDRGNVGYWRWGVCPWRPE